MPQATEAPAPRQPPPRRRPAPKAAPRAGRWPVAELIRRAEPLYGPAIPPRADDPVSELVYTILSQHTSDTNSVPACARLRETFDSWDAIAAAPLDAVVDAIKGGGLARIKGPRVQGALRRIKHLTGGYDLSFLGHMALPEAKAWLRQLPGVGPKTVACVLLFSLGMPALPVDTHVHRVAKRLGLIGPRVAPDESHDVLERMLAPAQVLPFHMYLITHGRRVCKAVRPLCAQCVLEERCPSSLLKAKNQRKDRPRRTAASAIGRTPRR